MTEIWGLVAPNLLLRASLIPVPQGWLGTLGTWVNGYKAMWKYICDK